MFKATVQYTRGFGVETRTFKADTFTEIRRVVNTIVTELHNREILILGYTTIAKVEKVVFSYPSGKTYTQRAF